MDEEDDWATLGRGVSLNGDSYWLGTSFFILDEKKKTLVCCRTEKHLSSYQAYVIGEEENGVREIDLGEFNFVRGRPLMFNYLPSLVQNPLNPR